MCLHRECCVYIHRSPGLVSSSDDKYIGKYFPVDKPHLFRTWDRSVVDLLSVWLPARVCVCTCACVCMCACVWCVCVVCSLSPAPNALTHHRAGRCPLPEWGEALTHLQWSSEAAALLLFCGLTHTNSQAATELYLCNVSAQQPRAVPPEVLP